MANICLRFSLKTFTLLQNSVGDVPEKHPQSSGRMGGAPAQATGWGGGFGGVGGGAGRGEPYASTGLKAGQGSPLPTGQEWLCISRRMDRAVCVLGCKELYLISPGPWQPGLWNWAAERSSERDTWDPARARGSGRTKGHHYILSKTVFWGWRVKGRKSCVCWAVGRRVLGFSNDAAAISGLWGLSCPVASEAGHSL